MAKTQKLQFGEVFCIVMAETVNKNDKEFPRFKASLFYN